MLVSGIEAPKDTPWSGKIGLSMNYTDNTKTSFNGRLSGSIEKKTDDEHFHFGGWYLLQYNNGKLTQNKAFMELSQDWLQPDSPWMTFFDAQYQYNRYEAWEHQLSPNAGVGYTVWDTLEYGLTLKGGAGARYRYTDRQLDGQLYLRADGRLQVARDQEFAGFLQLTPAFDDPGNTQGIVQLNYTIKMDIGVPFSTKVFLQNNFDTQPGPGDTANDLTIGVGMEYAF